MEWRNLELHSLKDSEIKITEVNAEKKVHIDCEKGAQISIFFLFSQYYIHIMLLFDQKTGIGFNGTFSLLKINFGHARISVPKIGIQMSKIVCIKC